MPLVMACRNENARLEAACVMRFLKVVSRSRLRRFTRVDRVAFSPVRSFDLHAAKHHDQFGRIDLEVPVVGSSQLLIGSTFKSLGPDRKTVVVPSEDLDVVAATIEEHEQVSGEQVDLEVLFDQP